MSELKESQKGPDKCREAEQLIEQLVVVQLHGAKGVMQFWAGMAWVSGSKTRETPVLVVVRYIEGGGDINYIPPWYFIPLRMKGS